MVVPDIMLRPVEARDQAFTDALYDSTRDDLHIIQADKIVIQTLLAMQKNAQAVSYRAHYPDAGYFIIEQHIEQRIEQRKSAVGRIVINSDGATLTVVDLSIMPSARRHGCASAVLRSLQRRAAAAGQTLQLTVRRSNTDASRLYLALGFVIGSADAVCQQLRWTP